MKNKILILCSVLISMLIIVPGVLAETTAIVNGNPALALSLTVTGTQSFGDMISGVNDNTTVSNSVKATVVSNAPWAVTANDAQIGGTPGHMAEWDGSIYTVGGKVLNGPLFVGSSVPTLAALSASQSAPLWTGNAVTTQDNFPYFQQTIVDGTDTRVGLSHNYRIVTTFTATPT